MTTPCAAHPGMVHPGWSTCACFAGGPPPEWPSNDRPTRDVWSDDPDRLTRRGVTSSDPILALLALTGD